MIDQRPDPVMMAPGAELTKMATANSEEEAVEIAQETKVKTLEEDGIEAHVESVRMVNEWNEGIQEGFEKHMPEGFGGKYEYEVTIVVDDTPNGEPVQAPLSIAFGEHIDSEQFEEQVEQATDALGIDTDE